MLHRLRRIRDVFRGTVIFQEVRIEFRRRVNDTEMKGSCDYPEAFRGSNAGSVDFCWISGLVSIVLQGWEGSRRAIKRIRGR